MQAVHELYSAGGAAVEPVSKVFPGCVVNGGITDQTRTLVKFHAYTDRLVDCHAAVSRPLLGPSVVGNEVPIAAKLLPR